MQLLIRSRTSVAQGIAAFELVAPQGGELPPFEAGAHIDLHLAGDLVRSYSLVNDPAERQRYVVAVNKDPASRGGSRYAHESLHAGQILEVSDPRNNFKLVEDAPLVVLIAGGIGITPMYCMILRLEALGLPWKLHYGSRSRGKCAYLKELQELEADSPGRVQFHFSDEHGGQVMDVNSALASAPADAHLYCCGPSPMLKAFGQATAGRREDHVHVEYFSAAQESANEGGFKLVLSRSRRELFVEKGKSILDALLAGGIELSHCCKEGVCGACQTTVIDGNPDHRDSYLSPAEKRSCKTIMPCCSGSLSPTLVLDL